MLVILNGEMEQDIVIEVSGLRALTVIPDFFLFFFLMADVLAETANQKLGNEVHTNTSIRENREQLLYFAGVMIRL